MLQLLQCSIQVMLMALLTARASSAADWRPCHDGVCHCCHSPGSLNPRHMLCLPQRTHAVASPLHPQSPTTAGACRVLSATGSAAPTSRLQVDWCSCYCCCCHLLVPQLLLQLLPPHSAPVGGSRAAASCCMERAELAPTADVAVQLHGRCCIGPLVELSCLGLVYCRWSAGFWLADAVLPGCSVPT